MKNKFFMFIIVFVSVFILAFNSTSICYATGPYYNTYNNHVNSNGVGDHGSNTNHYYVSSSATLYSAIIKNAIGSWNSTSTPIYYTESDQSSSLMDIYSDLDIPPSPDGSCELAETRFFQWLSVNPSSSNWFWTEIHTNQNSNGYPSLDTDDKQGTMAHEMGHSFGLAHLTTTQLSEVADNGTQVIMLQMQQGRTTHLPMSDDCTGINVLYP